jgi:hypothetical protein
MVYCKKATQEHHLSISFPECLLGINQIITREGQRCSLFDNDWIVLDLDEVEKKLKQKENRVYQYKTCDFISGIKINNAAKMVLVECRLNYINANNLKSDEISGKINGSESIVGHTPSIHSIVYFLFTDKVKRLASRKLREMRSNKKEYKAATISDLKADFATDCSSECRNNRCQNYTTQTA